MIVPFIIIFALKTVSASNILVFGGNGFMGSECVNNLIQNGHNVTIVNRGNQYWDFETRIKPFVHHFICDRYTGLKHCHAFISHITDKEYDATIDFSCYHTKVLEDSLEVLRGKTNLYIFISTDSVYEVCAHKSLDASREDDAQRPTNEEERESLNAKDSYGHRKLACEELLKEQRSQNGIPYVIFRLPDVIGPRDNTHRWWMYQLWLQFHNVTGQPIFIPQKVSRTLSSLVYVKDISNIILHVLKESKVNDNIIDEVFNLGFKETFTLKKILYKLQKLLGVQGIEYQYSSSESAFHLYPSVYRGPVNITKAEKYLGWCPTSWVIAAAETVNFYKQAFYTFDQEKKIVLNKLIAHVVTPSYKDIFTESVQKSTECNEDSCVISQASNVRDEL